MKYTCGNPRCREQFEHTPAAMEKGNITFCSIPCWQQWREIQQRNPHYNLKEVNNHDDEKELYRRVVLARTVH